MMMNKYLFAFLIVYHVSQSYGWINYQMVQKRTTNLENAVEQQTFSSNRKKIIRDGGTKVTVSLVNKPNKPIIKKLNAKKEKFYEIQRPRVPRFGENNTKAYSQGTNSSQENYFLKQLINSKDANSSYETIKSTSTEQEMYVSDGDGEQNVTFNVNDDNSNTTDYLKQQAPRHLWGQDRSIHSYRSIMMHKKPFWYSPNHFPRVRVTVAGLNIPWFRLRQTFYKPIVSETESVTYESGVTIPKQLKAPILNLTAMLDRISENAPSDPDSTDTMITKIALILPTPTLKSKETTLQSNITSISNTKNYNELEQTTESSYRFFKAESLSMEDFTTIKNDKVDLNSRSRKQQTSLSTIVVPMIAKQWPPWPKWLNEPLFKHKVLNNSSQSLNKYIDHDVYSVYHNSTTDKTYATENMLYITRKDDCATTGAQSKLKNVFGSKNDLKREPVSERLYDIDGIIIKATSTSNPYTESTLQSNIIPNAKNIVICSQSCPLTPEFNPICGSDGITYTNPGRLLCLQFCGHDVKVKKYQPCSEKHVDYPNMINLFVNTALKETSVKSKNRGKPTTLHTTTFFYGIDPFTNEDDEYLSAHKVTSEVTTEMTIPVTISTTPLTALTTSPATLTTLVTTLAPEVKTYMAKLKIESGKIIQDGKRTKNVPNVSPTTSPSTSPSKSPLTKFLLSTLQNIDRDISSTTANIITDQSYNFIIKNVRPFSVTRSINDFTKRVKVPIMRGRNANVKNTLHIEAKRGSHYIEPIDKVEFSNSNGLRYIESPFGSMQDNSGEYVSQDENKNDIFQDNHLDDVIDTDTDKFWSFGSSGEDNTENQVKAADSAQEQSGGEKSVDNDNSHTSSQRMEKEKLTDNKDDKNLESTLIPKDYSGVTNEK